jgi:F0F1-type ATP synthase membrane subunit b/b'
VFAAAADERRDNAEARAKRERLAKAAKDARRKEDQNERQRRHRELKRSAEEAKNPGGKKRKVRAEIRFRIGSLPASGCSRVSGHGSTKRNCRSLSSGS